MKKQKFQPKFLVDQRGKHIAVQLDLKAYNALLEEAEDKLDVKRAEKIMAKKKPQKNQWSITKYKN